VDNSADNGRFYLYAEYVHPGDRSRRQIEETDRGDSDSVP